jgi:hypothetical protein
MSKILIYEKLNEVKTLEKGRGEDGFIRLKGTFGVCGVRNNNNRVYEASNYKTMVDRIKQRIVKEGVPGQLEHPQTMNIDLNEVSHMIEDINIDENGVVTGTIKLLDTPKGKVAQALVEGGLPLFISSRATGSIDKATGKVTLEDLKTYDLVGTPGFSQARLDLAESEYAKVNLGAECISESIDDNMFIIEAKEEPAAPANKENEFNMTEQEHKELLDRLNLLEEGLKKANKQIEESNSPERMTRIAEAIQNWMINEYSPSLQTWVVEEASKVISTNIHESMLKQLADGIQGWMVNEMAPQIQNWMVEHFAEENNSNMIQQIAEGVQNWMLQEVSPNITKWVVEEYTSTIDKYIQEHLQPALLEQMKAEIANVRESKESKLAALDHILDIVAEGAKPVIGKVNESANLDEPLYIRQMPESCRPLYESASEEMKNFIGRKARLFNLATPEAIAKFWESIDWKKNVAGTAPVMESSLDNIDDMYERNLRMQLRKHRING